MAIEKELLDGLNMIAQGKEEGFNILYSYTYNYVYGKAKFIMKNEDDALDLTQETFIQAYRGIGSLEDANNVYAWLGGIVYRQGMRIYRKKRELLVDEDAEGIFEDVISEDMDTSPEDATQAKATSEIVMSMIEELPELQRSAILAFYYDNMKIDDIAKMFECSSNTIKSRLNYAKKFLKSKVEEHEKQNRYKLCSVSPAILLLSLKSLFTTDSYIMLEEAAQTVYNASCGAVGVTPSTLTFSAPTATQSASVTGTATQTGTAGMGTQSATTATTVAGKVGLTLGAKIGIGLTTFAVTGSIVIGAVLHNNDASDNTPLVQEEIIMETVETMESTVIGETVEANDSQNFSEEVSIESKVAEETTDLQPVEETYGWEKYIGSYLYRDGLAYPENGGCLVHINNVHATSENEADVTFDITIENVDAYANVTETLSMEGVGISNKGISFEATSSVNNKWLVDLYFMADGSINMMASVIDPALGGYDLRAEGGPAILTKIANESFFQPELKIQEGQYQFTTGGNAFNDGGYVLTISDLSDTDKGQSFTMQLDIISEGGNRIDSLIPEHSTTLKGNICTFLGDTGWGNTLYGYFYVSADGSVQLVYDAHTINPDMTWFGAYPEYADTPIPLTSGVPTSTNNLVTSTTDNDTNTEPITVTPVIEDAVAENDIVVKVGNVNIPLSSTWDEFLALAQANNWIIDDSLYPDPINQGYKHAYNKKGSVTTPQGDLLVCIMPNADYSGAEIKYIALSPFYLESEDASILGITPSTNHNDIGKKYKALNNSDPYLYKVDEYVTLRVTLDTYNDKNTVRIERTSYEDRE